VIVLDVRGICPVTDFFVIATGTSPRQMCSVCDDIQEMARPRGFNAISQAGYGGDTWVLLDYVDVIVHLFSEQARQYYDLDNLWGDARPVDWQEAREPPAPQGASSGQ
jgi:ribosome-associated protein